VVSRSPETADEDPGDYLSGWYSMNALLRQGYSWSGRERNACFLNLGPGPFAGVGATSGFDFEDDGRALAAIDWEGDGDLDLIVKNRTGPRVRLLRNELPPGDHFVAFLLEGVQCNRDAVGARVELELEGGVAPLLVRTRRAGEGFLAQGSAWLHFGLGEGRVRGVLVRWPGGEPERFEGVERGGRYHLRQGEARARPAEGPREPQALTPAPCEAPRPESRARLVLPVPVPVPTLEMVAPAGRVGRVFGVRPGEASGTGRPLFLALWSESCPPCVGELRELAAAAPELAAAGLEVMALSVDGTGEEERQRASAFLERLGWPFWQSSAGAATLDVLDVLHGALVDSEQRIGLPHGFLIDPWGDLLVSYTGRVELPVLLADLALVGADAQQRRNLAVPFPGRWRASPPEQDLAYFEARFRRRGLVATAQEFAHGLVRRVESSPTEMLLAFGRANLRAGQTEAALAALRSAVDGDPDHLQARVELVAALRAAGQLAEALALCEQGLALAPGAEALWLERGRIEHARGSRERAWRVLERLRELGSPLADELQRLLES
jgi:thiol-disulfide isomerase/thioredoxin